MSFFKNSHRESDIKVPNLDELFKEVMEKFGDEIRTIREKALKDYIDSFNELCNSVDQSETAMIRAFTSGHPMPWDKCGSLVPSCVKSFTLKDEGTPLSPGRDIAVDKHSKFAVDIIDGALVLRGEDDPHPLEGLLGEETYRDNELDITLYGKDSTRPTVSLVIEICPMARLGNVRITDTDGRDWVVKFRPGEGDAVLKMIENKIIAFHKRDI